MQNTLNYSNTYFDEDMKRVSITSVQQINNTAFYHRGNRWIDSRLVEKEQQVKPTKVIEYGSKEFLDLADKLARDHSQGSIALRGEILLLVDNEPVLVRNTQ
jgi:hypothetical protein